MRTALSSSPDFQKFFGDLQILRAGIVEKSLLGIEFRQTQHAFKRRLELADLFIHGDGFDREALRGIGIANGLETFDGFVIFARQV